MTKVGKGAGDIFAPTASPAASPDQPVRRKMGRPVTHDDPIEKVTVVLLKRQIVFLDELAVRMRAKTGKAIKRAEIIRALVDALEDSRLDVTAAASEADLKVILTRRLSG